jgi:chitin disaccharide deacetylase
MRLIINADDLGRTLEANEAIFALMELGLVTSATIMANSPFVEEAIAKLSRFPRCSFGIHLNVTEFSPLSSQPALGSLLDQAGNFNLSRFRKAVLHGPLKQAILNEWSAQVRKLQSYGITISHIDSHHGVHTEGRLFGVLKCLQHKFDIRKVRIRETIAPSPGQLLIRSRCWNIALRLVYPTHTTSAFTDFSTFLQAATSLAERYATLEVMVHPGHPRYASETSTLMSFWRERLPSPVELISYHEI